MATTKDYIVVDTTKPLGRDLVRLASLLHEVRSLASRLLNNADHNNDGADYTDLEANFGLQVGDGTAVRTQLSRADNILNQSGAELTGTQRINQLDEFEGRISGQ